MTLFDILNDLATGIGIGIGIVCGYVVMERALDGRLFTPDHPPLVATAERGTAACDACGLLQPDLADNCIECGTEL